MKTIDLTPTWGEWGNIYARLAESGERNAVKALRQDLARAMASCQALQAIKATLNDAQLAVVAKTLTEELTKQGF